MRRRRRRSRGVVSGRAPAWRRRALAALGAAGVAAYLVGLWSFAAELPIEVAEPTRVTDAIIVLTGGRQRVDTGLRLLAQGAAGQLFISGVNRDVDLSSLLGSLTGEPTVDPARITLGREAGDTLGNATETAAWVAARDIRTARLVTASYHMPRGLLEFHRAMPDLVILPHPVSPPGFQVARWWSHPASAGLIIGEYTKFLGAKLRHLARSALGTG